MNRTINRRSFLAASAAAAAAPLLASATVPGFSRPPAEVPAVVTREAGKLRILAITDLHYFWRPGSHDRRTSDHLRRLTEQYHPELIVNCGDFWMENPEGKGLEYCKYATGEIEKLGVPWVFARGNHDMVSPDDEAPAREVLTTAPHSLYRGADSLDNYRVEISSPGADRPFWNIYLLNNAYPALKGFHQEQLDWFAAEAAKVRALDGDLPAFAFFHIPLIEWKTMVDSGDARGVKLEPISVEEGSPGAFAALKKENQVRAMFCGHDHLNNYRGQYEGVHLEFLRSTGQGGYGGMQVAKGATLIELDASGPVAKFETFTVMPDGRKFAYRRRVWK